uniref:Uncharacterized protein n=1 Tax=Ciona savignyi TaxID=51511 RepID=H2ZCP9_CIOSA
KMPLFTVGERVLCYEPDKSKAKVLYDAKILDADYIKDGKSRKPEYKIHFQGWNSAWDRWADECYVLKSTEENRKLQRKLARQALRQIKGRKKVHLPGVANILKSAPENETSSDSDSSLSSDRVGGIQIKEEVLDSECGTTSPLPKRRRKSTTSSSKHSEDTTTIDAAQILSSEYQPPVATVTRKSFLVDIPTSLQRRLEEDHKMVTQENKLVSLPTKLNVVQILENYIKYFAITHARLPSSEKQINDIPPDKNLSLCKETCEDLRILFDFTLPLVLLYYSEQSQCIRIMESAHLVKEEQRENVTTSTRPMKPEVNDRTLENQISIAEENLKPNIDQSNTDLVDNPHSSLNSTKKPGIEITKQLMKCSKVAGHRKTAEEQIIEETHTYLIPDQPKLDKTGLSSDEKGRRRSSRLSHHMHSPNTSDEMISPPTSPQSEGGKKRNDPDRTLRQTPLHLETLVFLRSPANHQHGRYSTTTPLPHLIQQGGRYTCTSPDINLRTICREAYIATAGSDLKKAVQLAQVWEWSLFASDYRPQDNCNVPCSLVYGIQHFLRLFVKLPEIFARMDIRDHKLKIILKHIQLLLKFIVDHEKEIYSRSSSYVTNNHKKLL